MVSAQTAQTAWFGTLTHRAAIALVTLISTGFNVSPAMEAWYSIITTIDAHVHRTKFGTTLIASHHALLL